jgi:hypothetical protein
MSSTIITAFAVSLLIVGTWVADLACYHPYTDLNPQSPINAALAWK